MIHEYDVIVIGGGIAGLFTALTASENTRVAVISKVHVTRSHSVAAQGGIAACLGNEEKDNWEWHMYDTVKGSDFLADQNAVEVLAKEAPDAIYTLENMGVPFSRNSEGKIDQRRFGGHTKNYGEAPVKRACYVSDHTGRAIVDTLYDRCLQKGITFHNEVFIQHLLFELNNCCGAAGYDLATSMPQVFHSRVVVLATGGCGKIFKTTSNGFASTGDGFALALDALLPLEDMEFVQFHPTGIYGLGILISEAARAEGGVLRNGLGERFMKLYAPTLKDLAPRDIISRAIFKEIGEGKGVDGKDYVYLDLRDLGEERLNQKLPEITAFVKTYLGIDPSETQIPVAPTCHYMMGGIPTDVNGHVLSDRAGTILPGLFAAGECACVSVHGANRLGCNSLIDLVVFGRRVGLSIQKEIKSRIIQPLPLQAENIVVDKINSLLESKCSESIPVIRENMQQLMTQYCNVFRNGQALERALTQLRQLKKRCFNLGLLNKSKVFNYELQEAFELNNMLRVAEVIVYSALMRKESRGAHFRSDYSERNDEEWLKHTFVNETLTALKESYKSLVAGRFEPEEKEETRMNVTLKVYRFNPEFDKEPHYDLFKVEVEPNDRILDCLNKIRWKQDSTLSFRMSCAHGICGSDGLTINNQSALACQKLVKDYDFTKEILIEPLKYFRVVKDLIVDLNPFFERIKSITPKAVQTTVNLGKERIQRIQERRRFDDALKCILCGCCYSACPVITEQDQEFIGPAAILREQRYIFDSRTLDTKERLQIMKKPHGVWGCKSYYMCTVVCPKKIKVTEAILKTKKKIIQEQQSKIQQQAEEN